VAAGKEHLDIIAIVSAAAACHLRLPQRVFHACDLQIHAAHTEFTRRLGTTLQLLPHYLSVFLQFRHLLLHLCVRVMGHLQSGQGLRLTQLRLLQLPLQGCEHFIL